jgi:hypothetical protein
MPAGRVRGRSTPAAWSTRRSKTRRVDSYRYARRCRNTGVGHQRICTTRIHALPPPVFPQHTPRRRQSLRTGPTSYRTTSVQQFFRSAPESRYIRARRRESACAKRPMNSVNASSNPAAITRDDHQLQSMTRPPRLLRVPTHLEVDHAVATSVITTRRPRSDTAAAILVCDRSVVLNGCAQLE